MKKLLTVTTAALALSAGMALSDGFADAIVADLQANGYTYIEIEQGPTQLKAEAVRGNEKLEIIYDIATGAVLHEETETADEEDMNASGVEIGTEANDFVDENGVEIDDDEDEDEEDEDDDDDDESDEDDDDDEEDDA